MMNRRDTLKKMLWSSGSLISLPGWAHDWKLDEITLIDTHFKRAHTNVLGAVVDAILPTSNEGLGGLSIGVDQYLQKLFQQCFEEEVSENLRFQLENLNKKAQNLHGHTFDLCDFVQRQAILQSMEISEDDNERAFFDLVKSQAIRGFQTSREVMTHFYKYRLAPGFYDGCKNVEVP